MDDTWAVELSKDETLVLYTLIRQHQEQLTELSASVMAAVGALGETVPGFLEAYTQHKEDSGAALLGLGSDRLLAVIDGLIQKLRTQ